MYGPDSPPHSTGCRCHEQQHELFGGLSGLGRALAIAIASAVGEEIVFRGVVFRLLEARLGTTIALVLSAAAFGLLHAGNPGATWGSTLAIACESGVLLGLAYAASRALWLPIGLHFGWNFTEGGVFGAAVSGGQNTGLIVAPPCRAGVDDRRSFWSGSVDRCAPGIAGRIGRAGVVRDARRRMAAPPLAGGAPAKTVHPLLAERDRLGGPEGSRLEAPFEPQAVQERGEADGGVAQVEQ